MTVDWPVRLLAMSLIAGVVAMHSLVGVHPASPSADHAAHDGTASSAVQATIAEGATGAHQMDCTDDGCGPTLAVAMCVVLLTMLLLATVPRRGRVWAAATWESRTTPWARAGRRSGWLRTPPPTQLGISRT